MNFSVGKENGDLLGRCIWTKYLDDAFGDVVVGISESAFGDSIWWWKNDAKLPIWAVSQRLCMGTHTGRIESSTAALSGPVLRKCQVQ